MLAIGKMLNKILKYHFSYKNNYSCRYLVKIPKPYITLFITMTFFSLVFFFDFFFKFMPFQFAFMKLSLSHDSNYGFDRFI